MYNLETMEDNIYYIEKEDSNPEDYLTYFKDYYLPIVGGKAFLLYISFKNMLNQKISENNLISLLSLSKTDFLYARQILEGIGLISTFKNNNNFLILLNPVLPPSVFFNKKHLCSALLTSLDNNQKEYDKIVEKYKVKYELSNYENVSASFLDIYNIEMKKEDNNNYRISLKSDNSENNFSFSIFLKELKKNSQITPKMLKDSDQEKIEYLANLYGVNELEMARYITIFYNLLEKEHPINYNDLEQEIIKNSTVSQIKFNNIDNNKTKKIKSNNELIKYYQSISPLNFLRETLNGKEPSNFEKNIIMMLSNTYHFSSDMIVAILDYALKKDKNRLFKNNIESYSDALIRNGVNDIYTLLENLYNEKTIKEVYKEKNDSIKEKEKKEEQLNLFDYNDNNINVVIPSDDEDFDI